MTVYAALLRLYPRDFREEYAEDMALLLRHQLRDEPTARVWARALVDLALTVPPQHLEAHMSRPVSTPAVYGTLGVVSAVLATLSLWTVGVAPVGAVGALVFGGLAVVAWRRAHALDGTGHAAAHWWKYVLAGAAGLAAALGSVAGRDELAGGPWAVFAGVLLTSVVLLATGAVLFVVRSHRPA